MTTVQQQLDALAERLGDDLISRRGDGHEHTLVVRRDRLHETLRFLKNDPAHAFDVLMDLAAVDLADFPEAPGDGGVRGGTDGRFLVVYHLYSTRTGRRMRLKVSLSETDPTVKSVVDLWSAADWMEREAWDMLGVKFEGHHNLKRLLTHKDFVGHALRKDYPVKKGQWLLELDDLMDELGEAPVEEDSLSELVPMNVGPSHPATHGTFRILCRLDGETVIKAVQEMGYLHRGFEKSAERSQYGQVVAYTDRLNYCSALMNNVGYCKTVESLLGVEIPERTRLIRVILSEISRIMDHFVCVAACLVDIGALTNFWYLFNVREKLYEVIEGLTGHRLTNSYVRIGGLAYDLQENFVEDLRESL
jgi:NADH-quinone oxidoreductase subunit C/D